MDHIRQLPSYSDNKAQFSVVAGPRNQNIYTEHKGIIPSREGNFLVGNRYQPVPLNAAEFCAFPYTPVDSVQHTCNKKCNNVARLFL